MSLGASVKSPSQLKKHTWQMVEKREDFFDLPVKDLENPRGPVTVL